MTAEQERKGKAALGAAARAFSKAQEQGHVWISEQGSFWTIEGTDLWVPSEPKNPDQLRLV